MPYDHSTVEPKWQSRWREAGLHRTPTDPSKPKFYALDMFPYPSGAGLHVGHCEGYTATDVITRWKRMQGFRRAAPDGVGRVRAAGREVRHQARRPPARHDPAGDRQLQAADRRGRVRLRLDARDRHHRSGVREVDAVDLPEAVRARAGLRGGRPHQLVPRRQDRPRQRRGQPGSLRALRQPRRPKGPAAVAAAHHQIRRPPAGGFGRAGLARLDGRHAAQLDRPQRGGRGRVPERGAGGRARDPGVHDPPRHALRRDVHGAVARAPAGRGADQRRDSGPPCAPIRKRRAARATSSAPTWPRTRRASSRARRRRTR